MTKKRQLLTVAVIAGLAFLLLRSTAGYAGTIPELISDYHVAASDQEVAIMNPLSSNSCALIYVFNNSQTLQSCCGCLLSGNGLLDLSVANDLLDSEKDALNGLIEIIPSQPGPSVKCDPTKPPVGSGAVLQAAEYQSLAGLAINANLTYIQPLPYGPMVGGTTKTFFANVTINSPDASKLAAVCGKVQSCSCGGGAPD